MNLRQRQTPLTELDTIETVRTTSPTPEGATAARNGTRKNPEARSAVNRRGERAQLETFALQLGYLHQQAAALTKLATKLRRPSSADKRQVRPPVKK